MTLSKNTTKKLHIWITTETWYKSNSEDIKRFFQFINEYSQDIGNNINDENMLLEIIASEGNISLTDDHLVNILREKISLMHNILDFLKLTKR